MISFVVLLQSSVAILAKAPHAPGGFLFSGYRTSEVAPNLGHFRNDHHRGVTVKMPGSMHRSSIKPARLGRCPSEAID